MRWLFSLMLVVFLVGCTVQQKESAPAANTTTSADALPTVEQAMAAIMREYTLDKVCHDANQGWFVLFPITEEDVSENPWQGWFVSDHFKFYPLTNGTFVTVGLLDKDFVKVHPDITGLECTTQRPTPVSSQ